MDSFVIVRPSGRGLHAATEEWIQGELEHAMDHWRLQFRGIPRSVWDIEVTPEMVASSNLIIFGDPSSNTILGEIIDRLPVSWDSKQVRFASQSFDSGSHVPSLIYPNPLNPERYAVLNSGFTYREYDYLNNARQIPKLPDYAVYDLEVRGDARRPAGVAAAGFFDEKWELPGGD
jgi:hypothetical protein